MTVEEFKRQVKMRGMIARKQKRLEVFDVLYRGNFLFKATYAELHPLLDIDDLLARKIKPEYIPPLG